MDKETLSNYGWIVICVLVLAVMIALATPFGKFVSEAVQSTTKGLFDVNKSALDSTGLINIDNQEFDVPDMNHGAGENGGAGQTPAKDPALNPDGGTTPVDGDTYSYGDYTYTYSTGDYSGWAVALNTEVTDTNQTTYGAILESINGEPVTDMYRTFMNCTNLTTVPEIPAGVIWLDYTFYGCESLTTAPEIPASVTSMNGTFRDCTNLTTAPVIPAGVTAMNTTFYHCESLTTTPVIPASVTSMKSTFLECTSLTTTPVIPAGVTNMKETFYGCTGLTVTPEIPAGVTNMEMTFSGCTGLTTAPEIPASVEYMLYCFNGCTSLTGKISMPCSLASKNFTYHDCPATITYYHIDGCDGSCGK